MPLISKKQKTRVGLDVGSYAIKVVEMKETPTGSEVVKVGVKKLLPGAIVDGEPMDRDAVTSAIREIYEEQDIQNKEAASAICGRSVIIKKIKMEEMDDETAREVMTLEAEQYVPFEKEELSVDFEVLRRGLNGNTMEVLLVAAKRDKVLSHIALLKDAGLVPAAIDVDTFAVQNAFELNYEYEEGKVYAIGMQNEDVEHKLRLCTKLESFWQNFSCGGAEIARDMPFGVHTQDFPSNFIAIFYRDRANNLLYLRYHRRCN